MIRSRTETDPGARWIAAPLLALLFLGATPVRAGEPGGKAMAEALFREGKRLLDLGKLDEACEKLESSYRIDEALGTLLNLASCHEKQGKLATAWGEYNDALSVAKKAGQAPRQKFAQDHITVIEPRLAHLTVRVPAEVLVDGIVVTVDKVALARGAWGTPIPVDPGGHQIAAGAPGRVPWETRETLQAADDRAVTIPSLAALPPAPSPPSPSALPAAPSAPPPRSGWKLPVGIAAVGAGAVGIGVGAFFGVRAFSLAGQSNRGCKPDGSCSAAGYQAFVSGRSAATNANISLVAGGAAATVGAVLLILSAVEGGSRPQPRRTAFALHAAPGLAPGVGLVTVGGSW